MKASNFPFTVADWRTDCEGFVIVDKDGIGIDRVSYPTKSAAVKVLREMKQYAREAGESDRHYNSQLAYACGERD